MLVLYFCVNASNVMRVYLIFTLPKLIHLGETFCVLKIVPWSWISM